MCLLSYYDRHVMPAREDLEKGALLNPHGHGWALACQDHICSSRSLSPELEIPMFLMFRDLFPEVPALFHSRLSTSGKPSLEACHPMIVGGDPRVIVAHNGYLFTSPDGRSDTQVFAQDILPCWDIDDPGARRELEALIAPSRAVILRAGKAGVILNEHLGITLPDGSWHSNADYAGVPRPDVCRMCHKPAEVTPVCPACEQAAEPRRVILTGGSRG